MSLAAIAEPIPRARVPRARRGLLGPGYSVEHLFFQIPREGEYEFWVRHAAGRSDPQAYGIAWWTVAAVPEPSTLVLFATGIALLAVRFLKAHSRGSVCIAMRSRS